MSGREHHYAVVVEWTGNTGSGTSGYRDFERVHRISAEEKVSIEGSADPAFRGDLARWNPEELLLASLPACHKLWYLHLCAVAGVVVTAYRDAAEGTMVEDRGGGGQFTQVTLHPMVTLAPGSDLAVAEGLHAEAHAKCFIARSVNFPVEHVPVLRVEGEAAPD